jgi:hypothetical protein
MLDFEQFTKAAADVERIIRLAGNPDLRNEIVNSTSEITDERMRRDYYRYMNSLFLNILLNRLNELGVEVEQRALIARRILNELINPS